MLNIMEYKGIQGYIEYVPHANEFQVKTLSLTNNFYAFGKSATELKSNFEKECDNYIAECEKNNIPLFKTTYGTIHSIKISPDLHEKAIMECELQGISIDELTEKAFCKYFNLSY